MKEQMQRSCIKLPNKSIRGKKLMVDLELQTEKKINFPFNILEVIGKNDETSGLNCTHAEINPG